jgi:hypothetical protein
MPSGMLCHVALVRANIPLKRQFLQEPRGITSQKMAFFMVTAVRTSDLTCVIYNFYC